MKKIAVYLIPVLFLLSCNNDVKVPETLNEDGSYSFTIASPVVNGQSSQVASRMISGNFNFSMWGSEFTFSWNIGDVVNVIPFDENDVKLGDVIPVNIDKINSDGSIDINVNLPVGTDHFTVTSGPDVVNSEQHFGLNQIAEDMVLFEATNCAVDQKTIELQSKWTVLLVSPQYQFAVEDGVVAGNTLFKVGIEKVELTQYFTDSKQYHITYKVADGSHITATAGNTSINTPCPIVVYPAVNEKCSLNIKIYYCDADFTATESLAGGGTRNLRPNTTVNAISMKTDGCAVNLNPAAAYGFSLKDHPLKLTWVVVP